MYKGITPTLNFILPFSTDLVAKSYITLRWCDTYGEQLEIQKTKTDCEYENNTIKFVLKQEETLDMPDNTDIIIQLTILTRDNVRMTSQMWTISADRILKEGVISGF